MDSSTERAPAARELGTGLRARTEDEEKRRAELGYEGPLSPETVLVAPPEFAELARRELPRRPASWSIPRLTPKRPRPVSTEWAAVQFAIALVGGLAIAGALALLVVLR